MTGLEAKRFEVCPSVASWCGHRFHEGGVGVAEELTAIPPSRSRYSRPSASQTWAPSPRTGLTGGVP